MFNIAFTLFVPMLPEWLQNGIIMKIVEKIHSPAVPAI